VNERSWTSRVTCEGLPLARESLSCRIVALGFIQFTQPFTKTANFSAVNCFSDGQSRSIPRMSRQIAPHPTAGLGCVGDQQNPALAGRDRYVNLIKRQRQSFPSCFDVRLLASPAAKQSGVQFVPGKVPSDTPGPKSNVRTDSWHPVGTNSFHVDPNFAVPDWSQPCQQIVWETLKRKALLYPPRVCRTPPLLETIAGRSLVPPPRATYKGHTRR